MTVLLKLFLPTHHFNHIILYTGMGAYLYTQYGYVLDMFFVFFVNLCINLSLLFSCTWPIVHADSNSQNNDLLPKLQNQALIWHDIHIKVSFSLPLLCVYLVTLCKYCTQLYSSTCGKSAVAANIILVAHSHIRNPEEIQMFLLLVGWLLRLIWVFQTWQMF